MQCAIDAFINAASDYLNMKNIYLLQNSIVRSNDLMKKFIYVINVISIFLEIKYHAKPSSIK